jgi:LacI family transcriptional regulator
MAVVIGLDLGLRKSPTIREIARLSGVGTATVDRVLNGRAGVREKTRQRVLATLEQATNGAKVEPSKTLRRIAFLTDSGRSFNQSLREAVEHHAATDPNVVCSFTSILTADANPVTLAQLIERTAETAQGMVLVAREDVTVNRAIHAVTARGVPVICITSDLPGSSRIAYVGSDQVAAGSTAAYLMGRILGGAGGRILLVVSAPYRGQAEREMGFRSVLRSEFQLLEIDERANSRDDTDFVYKSVRKYLEDHGAPAGIYNVAAGNLGIASALNDCGLKGKVVFIGHELNPNSRMLLETGAMDFAIGHDLDVEVARSVGALDAFFRGEPPLPVPLTPVRVYTKYSCRF